LESCGRLVEQQARGVAAECADDFADALVPARYLPASSHVRIEPYPSNLLGRLHHQAALPGRREPNNATRDALRPVQMGAQRDVPKHLMLAEI
jgi:hypothetical protein